MPHAREAFYRWLASWAMALRTPADLGYDGSAFTLPPLHMHEHFLAWETSRLVADGDGQFGIPSLNKLHGIQDRMVVRQQTVGLRCTKTAELVRQTEGPLIIWCGLNEEGAMLSRLLSDEDIREVKGSDSPEWKEATLLGFAQGDFRILLTKGRIAGWGMNYQHAHTAIVCGMNDSQELFYQLVRREWRYGQQEPVHVHVVLSDMERPIWENVQRKEQEASVMITGLIEAVKTYEQEELTMQHVSTDTSAVTTHQGDGWTLHHGDCVEGLRNVPDHSLHLTIYSPPFQNLYQYHDSPRDMGNTQTPEQFFAHHAYAGNRAEARHDARPHGGYACHASSSHAREGWLDRPQGLPGADDSAYGGAGLCVCGRSDLCKIARRPRPFVSVPRDWPFIKSTKMQSWSRPCLGDYIILFRAPGENPIPVTPDIDNETWIIWAANIWLSTYYDSADGYREGYTAQRPGRPR